MGKGRHGGGHGGGGHGGGHGGHGGFGGHHGGGFGGHPGGGGFAHHGGVGARGGVGIGGMHGAMQHGPGGFHHGGMGVGVGHSHHRMFHGGPGYRGWWHPGGFGYWHGGWAAGYGWFGRPCFGWFYPGWFYGWYSNLMFPGSPWFFGYPYYRPWYLPPRPTTTVVVIQQSQPQPTVAALPNTALSDTANIYGSAATAGVPPSYAVATSTSAGVGPSESSFASASAPDVSAVLASNGGAPFGGEGEAEPSLPPAYSSSIKATIEAAFDYACQHASVFWKFADSYPSGFAEIDAYFQRFAVQKEIDSAVFPDSSIQNTLSFWDKLFCSADSTFLRKKELRTQRIKSAYREFLLHHTATESSDFNNNYSNFQIAAHSLYGCISKRYSNMNSNEPVIFDFEELKAFIAMLENRFGTTELAIDTEKSKSGQVPFFVVVQKNGR